MSDPLAQIASAFLEADKRDILLRAAAPDAGYRAGIEAAARVVMSLPPVYAGSATYIANAILAITPPPEAPHSFTDPIVRLAVKDAATKVATAVAEGITPPAPWAPPPEGERPEGYRCLGRVQGLLTGIIWYDGAWCYDQILDLVTPTAFAPLPPEVEA